ncbi:MAG: hypothetical protein HQM06_00920 [Magnetococcales bacterium]|nr:hypothetical protein [Magnetococcales bacterium]
MEDADLMFFKFFDISDADEDGFDFAAIEDFVDLLSDDDKEIIINILQNAKCILIERDYIDKDYRNVYSGYYSKKFSHYNGRAIRIHIFDVMISISDFYLPSDEFYNKLKALSDEINLESYEGTTPGYRGSVVLRPTEYSRVGRCLIDPRKIVRHSWAGSKTWGALAEYRVVILCQQLKVLAFPHQSQDAEAHVCAETALWSLFRYLSQRYPYYREIYPFDIALLNKDKSRGRTTPSQGLTMEQIASVFAEYGLAAEYFDPKYADDLSAVAAESDPWHTIKPIEGGTSSVDALVRYLHVYVDSALPPIVGLPEHAVVAFGYICGDTSLVDRAGKVMPSSDFVHGFVINDDNISPYQAIIREAVKPADWQYRNNIENIDVFVAPLPDKVFLYAYQAENITDIIISSYTKPSDFDAFPKIIRRMYCTSSKNYKEFRRGEGDPMSHALISLSLPHFLWVTEFIPETCWQDRHNGAVVCMEIVLDATAGKRDKSPFLWIRTLSKVWLNAKRIYGKESIQSFQTASPMLRSFRGNHKLIS